MLSIPIGWYLFRPNDVVLHYWNGHEFTNDIAPRGRGEYSSLKPSALRKWNRARRKEMKSRKLHPVVRAIIGNIVPDGYISS